MVQVLDVSFQLLTLYFFAMFIWNMAYGTFAKQSGGGTKIKDESYRRRKAVLKMFFVMGPTWLAEIIAFALPYGVCERLADRLVFPFNVINALQVSVSN